MTYVDGFVLVVPKKKIAMYKKMAAQAGKIWRKHGALDYKECMGEDMKPSMGGMRAQTFPKMAKCKRGETVWFSFIVYKSRAHRDSVNKKVMKDFDLHHPEWKDKEMPFDMKRFAYGGFKAMVDA